MTLTLDNLTGYATWLRDEEKSKGTIAKYTKDASDFIAWLDGRELTKDELLCWKMFLCDKNIAPCTVNGKLASLNSLLKYVERADLSVKYLKVQRRVFRDPQREMTKKEFRRLLKAVEESGDIRLLLLMESIACTGIRVSELRYITVEAVKDGRAIVNLKNKVRIILIPKNLAGKLLKYAQEKSIASGAIFITRNGNPMDRRQIWEKMKAYCKKAGVESSKVFPHNLRHLFARAYYEAHHDIVALADILGHSSIETTRIYLITTGDEYSRQLDGLRLVS